MRVKVPAGVSLARRQQLVLIETQTRAFASSSRAAPASQPPITHQPRNRIATSIQFRHVPTRHSSSSAAWSPFSRIFGGRRGKSVTSPDDDFRHALARGDVASLCSAYDRLTARGTASSGQAPPALTSDEWLEAMELLSRSRRRGAVELLRKLHFEIGRDDRRSETTRLFLSGLCLNGLAREAFSTASELEASGNGADVDWLEISASAIRFQPDLAETVLDRAAQYESPADVLALRLRHLRIDQGDEAVIQRQLGEIESRLEAVRASRSSYITVAGMAELVRLYARLGQFEAAERLVSEYVSDGERMRNTAMRNAIIELRGASGDLEGVREVVKQMREAGDEPPYRAVLYLALGELQQMPSSRAPASPVDELVQAVDRAERETGLQAPASVWSELLHTYLTGGTDRERSTRLTDALEAYRVGKARGLVIDTQLARTLIKPLCLSQPPRLDEALAVYRDWNGIETATNHALERDHIVDLYAAMLRAAAVAKSPSTAVTLFTDLRERRLPLPAAGATSILIALLPAAKDHREAFNIYAQFYALNVHSMSRQDYEAILSAFLAFSTDSSPFAPTNLYLEMLRDMRKSGYAPGSESLTSLLSSYIREAKILGRQQQTREVQRQLSELNEAVADIHNLIHLDTLVEVDVALLSALMNAYSHLGSFRSAFDVWTELLERRPREDPTKVPELYAPALSIILDTCGFSANPDRAARIWAWAQRWRIPNERNWLAYIECLCRTDRLETASDLVFGQMKDWCLHNGLCEATGGVNRDAVEILLRFSWRSKEAYRDVQDKVKLEVPELWQEVKGIVETRTARLRARQSVA